MRDGLGPPTLLGVPRSFHDSNRLCMLSMAWSCETLVDGGAFVRALVITCNPLMILLLIDGAGMVLYA